MRLSFREADWEALARLWAEFYPPRYLVDAELLKQNTVDCPVFDWGASAIEVFDDETRGFVAVKRSANPLLWAGPNQDTYHLSAIAYKEPEVGVDLMSRVKKTISDRGASRLLFGMDSQHFFPGCPEDCQSLCSFLMVEGFEKSGDHFDLERDLSTYELPAPLTPGVSFRSVTVADSNALKSFLNNEFPGRWTHDVLDKVKIEGSENTCFGAFEDGQMLGFSMIQDWRHRKPVGGGIWRCDLGDKWGALGPIGVAKDERGRGVGNALLGSSLMELKGRGVQRCIIDWTTLGDFYGRHGFEVSRRYKTASLKLE